MHQKNLSHLQDSPLICYKLNMFALILQHVLSLMQAHLLKKEIKLMELVDSRLGPDVNENEIMLNI